MRFVFEGHHPNAYRRFIFFLVAATLANAFVLAILYPYLQQLDRKVMAMAILVVPWFLLLFLPSIIGAVIFYRSLIGRYEVELDGQGLTLRLVGSSIAVQHVPWCLVRQVKLVDFEDNHFCQLHFDDARLDVVLHRNSGDFDTFFQQLRGFLPDEKFTAH